MRKINVLIGLSIAMISVWSISGCAVTPLYDDMGYYSAAPNVAIYDPPLFLSSPSIGFYSAIGIPYDLYYFDPYYYLNQRGYWYRSHHYNGPWGSIKYKSLPHSFQKHRYADIIRWRDNEHRSYKKDRNRYKGRHFRPERHKVERRESVDKKRHQSPNRNFEKRKSFNNGRRELHKRKSERPESVNNERHQSPNRNFEKHNSFNKERRHLGGSESPVIESFKLKRRFRYH